MSFDILIPTKDLARALGLCTSIVEKRNALPILGHIKLDADNGALKITATDMDLSICQDIGAQIKGKGALAVPAQTFGEIIKKIPDQDVSLKLLEAGNQLEIVSKNCRFTISTLPAAEFPAMENIGNSHKVTLSASSLAELLEHTKFAMSTEETRYNLNGIYLHALADSPNILSCAATDGHRLSTSATMLDQKLPAFGVILPRKCVQELLKIIKDPWVAEQELEIDFGQNRVKFSFGKVIMISKLIDGSFPEYHNFIPASNPHKLTINAKALAEVVDRVATVTVDKFRAVKLICDSGSIEVHASGEARGIGHEVVVMNENDGAPSYHGITLTIGFNPRYLLDALSAVGSGLVTIALQDPFSPALVTSDTYPYAKFVVMPVKV
jgi:DNA polymerase-3 subunit beta